MEKKKGKWEDWEKDYLFKHYDHNTDEELAAHLGRTKTSVIQMRRKLSIKKNKKQIQPEQINELMSKHREITDNTSVQDLDEAQQRRFWLNDLQQSSQWQQCKAMFDENELSIYQVKYVEMMLSLETVTEVEKGSVHLMISALIRFDRYQQLEKEYRDMAQGGGGDMELIAKANSLHREMKDTFEMYAKAEDALNVSRKQRIKEEGDQRLNLLELIKELDTREAREKMGREADALKYIKDLEGKKLTDGKFIR